MKGNKSIILKKKANSQLKSKNRIEQTYKKLKHREHVLHEPGMYIGPIKSTEEEMFIYDDNSKQMIKKKIRFVPGLYKIFDEGLVNMRDHHVRMKNIIERQKLMKTNQIPIDQKIELDRKYRPVKSIEITINAKENTIILKNDGDGIDIAWHNEEKIYVPELIFGHLLSGTNFDKQEKKIVGGKHGYGAKLINLFSDEFIIETVDSHNKLKYKQVFKKNMSIHEEPIIEPYRGVPYTQITFKPDLARFGLKSLQDDDTIQLMKKRVYDIAACTSKEVIVRFNGEKIEIRTFQRYVDLYIGSRGTHKREHIKVNDQWEIVVSANYDGKFEHVSFVNGICTYRGGKHVDHASTVISNRLSKYANEKKKGINGLTPKHVKENLWIFINSTIINPDFDTQTKENLTTNTSDFGSKCNVPDDFITKLSQPKIGILEKALKLAQFKSAHSLKKSDGKKLKRVKNDKLIDAHYAGGKYSNKCTLILTEGDSAQTFAVSGLAVLSEEVRKYYGIMPLKGKIINPKDCKVETIEKNRQFIDIKQIMALKQNLDYSKSSSGLRYGSIMILTDADKDGDHIKGLIFNLFHEFWPSLLKKKNFFLSILTPIIKVSKKNSQIYKNFYSEQEYYQWKRNQPNFSRWERKYYKGLGTHDALEAKQCFKDMKILYYSWFQIKKILKTNDCKSNNGKNDCETGKYDYETGKINYVQSFHNYYQTENKHPCDLALQLAFSKKLADCRKGWITNHLQLLSTNQIDYNQEKSDTISFYDFINTKFIQFSIYDNMRNIPNILDGLKPGQRKILYAAFKRKLRKEVKVAQFIGYISEKTNYQHGEESLSTTLVNLAQDYPGSNNINLFVPKGQFGTRVKNGSDSASARYIYTFLNPLTVEIYNSIDENIYQYRSVDVEDPEPKYYIPIIPMILINGSKGIGTGWSTDIPQYNPSVVIDNVKRFIKNQPIQEMIPWYRGFRGTITKISNQKFEVKGLYKRINLTTIEITEIPLGNQSKSFNDYKNFIESLIIDNSVNDQKERDRQILLDAEIFITDTNIKCILHFPNSSKLHRLMSDINDFEKKLKLINIITTTNMNLFNADYIMTKYNDPIDILNEYCQHRYKLYEDRKSYLINQIEDNISKINSKILFIKYINDDKHPLKVKNQKKTEIITQLEKYNFPKFQIKNSVHKNTESNEIDSIDEESNEIEFEKDSIDENKLSYDYLLKMQIYSLTFGAIGKLEKELEYLKNQLTSLQGQTIAQLWGQDIDKLELQMIKFDNQWEKKYIDVVKLYKNKIKIPVKLKENIIISKQPAEKSIIIRKTNKIKIKIKLK